MNYHKPVTAGKFEITSVLGNGRFIGTTEKVVNIEGKLTNQAIFKLVVIGIEEYYLLEKWITK
jgi:hypothetical protein